MDIPDTMVERLLDDSRDSRRPAMGTVLEVMDAAFDSMNISVERLVSGPTSWVWEDTEMRTVGFPRFFVLSESAEYPGYPVFTVRQAYSVRFDTWISMSSLVIGPDHAGVSRSISLAMANHAGAFAGVRYAIGAITANQGQPIAGMVAVKMLLESPAPVVSREQIGRMLDEVDGIISDGTVN